MPDSNDLDNNSIYKKRFIQMLPVELLTENKNAQRLRTFSYNAKKKSNC